jgi:DNA-binding response OmpR family regulator
MTLLEPKMEPELLLPIDVLMVGLDSQDEQRFIALFDRAETLVTVVPTLDTEDVPTGAPDLLIMNTAPGAPGIEQVQHARRRWPGCTVMCINVATAPEAIALLEAGADDVGMANGQWGLVAALAGAALRRARVTNEQLRVKYGDIVYDREARRVWCAGREVAFTPRELRLFDILFQRAGRPVSSDTLEDFVWNDGASTSNTLAVYIGYLRRKLAGSRISMLETLRGSGYRLVRRD